jgi:hypothetical protein
MSIHEIDSGIQVRVIKRITALKGRPSDPMDEDLRRLCLSMIALVKRRYPNDWRRMLAEMTEAKAA